MQGPGRGEIPGHEVARIIGRATPAGPPARAAAPRLVIISATADDPGWRAYLAGPKAAAAPAKLKTVLVVVTTRD